MSRPYVTVTEYAIRHDIPRSTIYTWIREGKMQADETSYPKLVLDEGVAPRKVPEKHRWRYDFTDFSNS